MSKARGKNKTQVRHISKTERESVKHIRDGHAGNFITFKPILALKIKNSSTSKWWKFTLKRHIYMKNSSFSINNYVFFKIQPPRFPHAHKFLRFIPVINLYLDNLKKKSINKSPSLMQTVQTRVQIAIIILTYQPPSQTTSSQCTEKDKSRLHFQCT